MKEAYVPHVIDDTLLERQSFTRDLIRAARREVRRPAWPSMVLGDLAGACAALAAGTLWITVAPSVAAFALPAWIAACASTGLYDLTRIAAPSAEARSLLKATAIALGLALLFSPGTVPVDAVAFSAMAFAATGAVRFLFRTVRSYRPIGVLVVGRTEDALAVGRALARGRWSGYGMCGFVEPNRSGLEVLDGLRMVGTVDRLEHAIEKTGAGAVILVGTALPPGLIADAYERACEAGIDCFATSLPPGLAPWRVGVADLDGTPVLSLRTTGPTTWHWAAKRALDVVGAGIALLVTAPLYCAIVVAIKLDDPTGPVLFRQTRVGKDGRRFLLVKFRTMVDRAEQRLEDMRRHNEADGLLFKIKDDPRITRVGRFLRRTSLDELPQLWNVLTGDMSLVGPRPALPEETDRYVGAMAARLECKPGMTGLWQVSGRQTLAWADYVHYDLFYVRNWSVALDVAILARTLPAVLRGRGAW